MDRQAPDYLVNEKWLEENETTPSGCAAEGNLLTPRPFLRITPMPAGIIPLLRRGTPKAGGGGPALPRTKKVR